MTLEDRAGACFKGLATGDAVGKQTEMLSPSGVQKWYPAGIMGFQGRPGDAIPRYVGKRYEWRIGETTDDTEQSIAVARALLREGDVRHEAIGKELLRCTKSLHPGVSLWAFVQIGDPARIATAGDGCGAAMRTAPVGVLYPPTRLDDLVRGARECSVPTHGGQRAIAAAAAVAAAISAALDERPADEVLEATLAAARRAEELRASNRPLISESIEKIYADLAGRGRLVADEIVTHYFPNTPENIVPLAMGLALVTESAEETALLAANVGGDSDSVASIGSAIAGALRPNSVNERWFDVVSLVNGYDLVEIATQLAAMRSPA